MGWSCFIRHGTVVSAITYLVGKLVLESGRNYLENLTPKNNIAAHTRALAAGKVAVRKKYLWKWSV
jgi:hypothetical protein